MAVLPIVYFPDSVLRQKAEPVQSVDADIQALLQSMCDTMYESNGIGLAANQVNCLKRIVVIDVSERQKDANLIKMVNPEITWKSGEKSVCEEGCLSLPGARADVERPAAVEVRYLNEKGQGQTLKAHGILSTCIQHEIDHLNGILYVDYLTKMKRDIVIRKVSKYHKWQKPAGQNFPENVHR